MTAEFADCVVKRTPGQARKIVGGALLADRAGDRFNDIMGNCLPVNDNSEMTLNTKGVLLRFALADALLREQPRLELPQLQTIPPLKHVSAATAYPGMNGDFEVAISGVGECIVRAAPQTAAALVHSAIGTPAEKSTFSSIVPALSGCLTAGQQFAFSPEVLRGTVALNYYRLATAGAAK